MSEFTLGLSSLLVFYLDSTAYNKIMSKKMESKHLTESQKKFVLDNYQTMFKKSIVQALGVTLAPVRNFMRDHNLKMSREKFLQLMSEKQSGKTSFTEKEDQFIKDNYLDIPVYKMTKLINRSHTGIFLRIKTLGLVIPKEIREQRVKDSQFKKGNVPFVKGKKLADYMPRESIEKLKKNHYKKGNKPYNYLPVGHEVVLKDGYTTVKIGDPNKWQLKQRYLYEKLNNIKLKPSDNIMFIDGNRNNFEASNLKKVGNVEMMLRNSQKHPKEIIPTMVLMNKLKRTINKNKKND